MNFFQALVLGVVQGLTEFLPVSSSAHLSIFGKLMGFDVSGDGAPGYTAFTAIIQIGTEVAVILYFFKDIVRILGAWFSTFVTAVKGGPKAQTRKKIGEDAALGWLIILGTLPIVVFGVILKKPIETIFRPLWLTAAMLIVFGVIIYLADRVGKMDYTLDDLKSKSSVLFGLAQCLALVPGVSRSGATISAGRLLGFNRETAAKYSFYLAIPSVLGAAIFELKDAFGDAASFGFPGWPATIVATVVSFIVGYIVIAAFMKAISKISFKGFAIYRVILGIVMLVLIFTGAI
ncbi:MAG: undecaprenyl-diphosphate phosphatase [Candidatus Ancillula sp.]|jgi:undecaprenyl-diphosphatase|nr:undecaprenyl-diphosphate phosphatase [Candidatus Ancillula sp.]